LFALIVIALGLAEFEEDYEVNIGIYIAYALWVIIWFGVFGYQEIRQKKLAPHCPLLSQEPISQ
jgi:hypothetical protein